MPKIKVKGQTVQPGEHGQTYKQTNGQTDGRYQFYYLPASRSIIRHYRHYRTRRYVSISKDYMYVISVSILKGLTDDMKVDLTKQCKSVITEKVFPALEDMKTYIRDTYLPKSRPDVGVGSLPNGEEYYKESLK